MSPHHPELSTLETEHYQNLALAVIKTAMNDLVYGNAVNRDRAYRFLTAGIGENTVFLWLSWLGIEYGDEAYQALLRHIKQIYRRRTSPPEAPEVDYFSYLNRLYTKPYSPENNV